MNLALQTLLLLVLMPLAAVGPGLAIVGRLRWEPLEKFVAAIGASLVIVYLCGFGLFAVAAPAEAYWAVMAGLAVLTVTQLRRLGVLWRCAAVRAAVTGYLVLCAWLFLLLCLVRHYGGGYWAGDWAEHYRRVAVFLRLAPIDEHFLGLFTLPARPPMMNVIAAFFCRLAGMGGPPLAFTSFSLVFLLLNAGMVLPGMLIYRRLLARRRRRLDGRAVTILAALLCLNAFFVENCTWTWTKFLCAGYVLLGIHFYLRSWRLDESERGERQAGFLVAALVFLAAGLMVHFSAWPIAAVIGVHAMVVWTRGRPRRVMQLAVAVAAAAALTAVWFGWSMAHFGLRGTAGSYFAAPPGPLESSVPSWERVTQNLLFSVVPQSPSPTKITAWFHGDAPLNLLRDYWFELAQSNLFFMVGSVSGVVLAILAWERLSKPDVRRSRRRMDEPRRRFWVWLVVAGTMLAIVSTARVERFGAGMLAAPVVILGLLLLAAELPALPAAVRGLVVVGCTVDFLLGIALHFWLQNWDFTAVSTPAGIAVDWGGFNQVEVSNWWSKQVLHLTYWGDWAAAISGVLGVAMVVGGLAGVGVLAAMLWRREGRGDGGANKIAAAQRSGGRA